MNVYIVLGNYNVGETIELSFEKVTDEGVCYVSCPRQTDEKGMVIIGKVELKKMKIWHKLE